MPSWPIRRLAVRLFGQGPRVLGSVAEFAQPLFTHPGENYDAPPHDQVCPDCPARVADWPRRKARAPNRSLYLIGNTGLYDDDGAIYDLRSRRAFIETLDYWFVPPHRHPSLALPRVHPPRHLPGLSLFLGGLGGQTFYHFLIDHLPRFALFAPLLDQARRLIVQAHIEDNKLAWLREAGCTLPVEWLGPLDHFHCEHLAFATRANGLFDVSPWTLVQLDALFPPPSPAPTRHRFIWAGRVGAPARHTPWEADLIARLPRPWEVIDFARLAPAAVRQTLAECVAFAGLHGAAFANLALAPRGLRVLEVFPAPNYAWYPAISLLKGHDHEILFASSSGNVLSRLAALAQ